MGRDTTDRIPPSAPPLLDLRSRRPDAVLASVECLPARIVAVAAVDSVRNVLETIPGVRLAVLFGSTARGRATRASDIDIGVSMLPGMTVPPSVQVAVERATGRQVGVTHLDDAPPLLRFEIGRDGIVLIEREPDAWARFRAQAMIDWWDWAPTARMMHRAMGKRLREEANRGQA